jgi:hypothetical protein
LVLQEGRLAASATRTEPLSRAAIEDIFGVSILGESCAGTPWRSFDDGKSSYRTDGDCAPKAIKLA